MQLDDDLQLSSLAKIRAWGEERNVGGRKIIGI